MERLSEIRDIFLFCCFTGLRYKDVATLKHEHIHANAGTKWIRKPQVKIKNSTITVPLIQPAMELIEQYRDNPDCTNGHIFPVRSNQKMNAYLKEIGVLSGIGKRMTTHVARHTFATVIAGDSDLTDDTICKLLDHSDVRITKIYRKTLYSTLVRSMGIVEKNVRKRLLASS